MSVLYCRSLSLELSDVDEFVEVVELLVLVWGAQMPPVVMDEAGDIEPELVSFNESHVCIWVGKRRKKAGCPPVERRITTWGRAAGDIERFMLKYVT